MPAFPYVDPGKHDFTCPQGTTWARDITWKDPDGNPYALEGNVHVRLMIRPFLESKKVTISLSTEFSSPDQISVSGGTISLRLTSVQTAAIAADTYAYDMEVVDPSYDPEFVVRLLEGSFIVDGEVTR